MAKGIADAAVNGLDDRNDTDKFLVRLLVFGAGKGVWTGIKSRRVMARTATESGGERRLR